jgi:hypothetical protein
LRCKTNYTPLPSVTKETADWIQRVAGGTKGEIQLQINISVDSTRMLLTGMVEKRGCTTRTTDIRSFEETVGVESLVRETFEMGVMRVEMTSVNLQGLE